MRRLLTSLAVLTALGVPAGITAQEVELPEIVSKVVQYGPGEARLALDLSDGRTVELSLSQGQVRMGDQVLGTYSEGGALESSWRSLVAQSTAMEDEILLQALVDWAPPEGLTGTALQVAERMDEFLTLNFDSAAVRALTLEATLDADALGQAIEESFRGLEGLSVLSRLDVLAEYADALEGLDQDNLRVVIDDYLEIGAGQDFGGSVLLIDGSMEVRGTIRGDVVVVDGDVELRPGSEIRGTVSLTDDSSIDNDGGQVRGGVVNLDRGRTDLESEIRAEILRELREDRDIRVDVRHGRDWGSPFRRIFGGLGDIFGTLFNLLILGGIGVALLHFAPSNMEAISETARESTGRALLVGMAGGALAIPVFILGIVGLAVTIIGIPAIILWLPLFPAAVVFASLAGYLAVSRNIGAWLSKQRYPYTDWVRVTNPVTLIFGGLLVLAAPFVVGRLVGMVGFLDIFAVLLGITGFVLSTIVGAIGLGAVLLTRGGRKPEQWGSEMFTNPWKGGRWGRRESHDPEAEAFDAELNADDSQEAEWEEAEVMDDEAEHASEDDDEDEEEKDA